MPQRTVGAFLWLLLLAACGVASPSRPPCADRAPLGTVCGFENPEDVAYVPSLGVLVLSEYRFHTIGGFLVALAPGGSPRIVWPTGAEEDVQPAHGIGEDGCLPPSPAVFAPHGISVDSRSTSTPRVYVVNHGGRESIEVFRVDGREQETRLVWQACVQLPPQTSGNDVAVAADGEVVVSNYMSSPRSIWALLKSLVGANTGDVLAWRAGSGWRHLPGTEASGPNGVEVSPDGKWVYYASTGGGEIARVGRGGGTTTTAPVPGRPDNLSWTSRGTLLLATHASLWQFLECVRALPCRSPWRLLEVDPVTLQTTELLAHDGDAVGAVSSAQEVGDRVYLGAVFDDRIGIWHRPPRR